MTTSKQSKLSVLKQWYTLSEATGFLKQQFNENNFTTSDLIDLIIDGKLQAQVRFNNESYYLGEVSLIESSISQNYPDNGRMLHPLLDDKVVFIDLPSVKNYFEHELFDGEYSQGEYCLCITLGSIELLRSFLLHNCSIDKINLINPLFLCRDETYFIVTKLPNNINNEKFALQGETEELQEDDFIAYQLNNYVEIGIRRNELLGFVETLDNKNNDGKVELHTKQKDNIGKIVAALLLMGSDSKTLNSLDTNQPAATADEIDRFITKYNRDSKRVFEIPSRNTMIEWIKIINNQR